LTALALGGAAFLLVMLITSGAGPGLDPDTMSYVGAATSLAHDGTLRVPSNSWDEEDSTASLSVWPPGFSTAMAIPQRLGASPLMSARIVMALAAFLSAAILFVLLENAAGSLAAVAAVAAVFATPAIVGVHLSALSEPLFLACLLLTLLAMVRRPRRPLIAGAAAAAVAMVRYAGVCAPMAVVLWFFFSDQKPVRRRFADAGKVALVPAIAIGWWVIRSTVLPDARSGMEVAVYGHLSPTLRQGIATIADWLAPGVETQPLRALAAIAMTAVIVFIIAKAIRPIRAHEQTRVFLNANLLMLSCYIATLIAARLFVGDAIPFDFRLLAPAILLTEAAIVVALAIFMSRAGRTARVAAMAVAGLWLVGSAYVSSQNAADAITDGFDLASSEWRESPTIGWVRSRGAGRTIFTNWPAALYFGTNRVVRDIPQSLDTAELRSFGEILRERHGAFVALSSYNTDYPPSDSIARGAGLVEAERFTDGKVWVSPESNRR
jgi:4-amino-4-deoxy-L-arabinose transferase-like glycosyltransferase